MAWLRDSPARWQTFVGNRVVKIQRLADTKDWHYVNTKDNPADLISRGTTASNLKNSKLWWNGPQWLLNSVKINISGINIETLPEERKLHVVSNVAIDKSILFKYSNFSKFIRVTAYILRFFDKLKRKSQV